MVLTPRQKETERQARLRLTMVPSNDGLDFIRIYSLDKRKIAEELIDQFSKNPRACPQLGDSQTE